MTLKVVVISLPQKTRTRVHVASWLTGKRKAVKNWLLNVSALTYQNVDDIKMFSNIE